VLAALRLARGFRTALLLSIAFGLLSVWIGLVVAFYADLAAGGVIVITTVVMLALAETVGRGRDYLAERHGIAPAGQSVTQEDVENTLSADP